jgi:SAM-dependent methyltransferase
VVLRRPAEHRLRRNRPGQAGVHRVPPRRAAPRRPLSELYDPDNVLDRRTAGATLAWHYARAERRERELLAARLGREGGDVLSVGAGWHPGRHLFPAPDWRLVAVDPDANRPRVAVERGEADEGFPGRAGELESLPDGSFDVVLYRLVLHHVAFHAPLAPVFVEARRLLRPGGALVAIEPGLWHPVGAALALANRLGLGVPVHGTPDDVPLSPRGLVHDARVAGLRPELHAVTYGWRRLPPRVAAALGPLDRLGSTPGLRALGHTLLLIARRD